MVGYCIQCNIAVSDVCLVHSDVILLFGRLHVRILTCRPSFLIQDFVDYLGHGRKVLK